MDKEKEHTSVPSGKEIDGEEFELFYNQWNDKLRRLAEYKLIGKGSYHDAVEIVQDAWHDYIVAVRKGKQIDEPNNWLYKVVSNKAANRLTSLVKETQHCSYIEDNEIDFDQDGRFVETDDYSSFLGNDNAFDYKHLKEVVLPVLIKDLNETDQMFFADYFVRQMNTTEIAAKHKVEPNNVSQRLFRIKRRIRKNYEKYKKAHKDD